MLARGKAATSLGAMRDRRVPHLCYGARVAFAGWCGSPKFLETDRGAVRKPGDQLQLRTHGLEDAAQRRDVHVAPRLELGDRVLPDLEALCDRRLRFADGLAKVLQ